METSRFKFIQFAHVEPILFVYSHWLFLIIPVMNQYLYYRISEDVGFPYQNLTAEGGCSEEKFGGNSSLRELETEVQSQSANLFTYYIICCVLPSIIISPFMGSYTDKKGRKLGLIAPLAGALVETTVLLAVVYFKLSVYITILGGIINGLTGYLATSWMALMSYLSDTVEKDKLSLRMTILQLCLFLAGTVSQLTSGLWIEYLGFKAPMWFLWGSLVLVTLYTTFFVKETIIPKENDKTVFFTCESLRRTFRIFTKRREGGRKNLILLFLLIGINIFATVGTASVQLLYLLRSPLCWIPSTMGYYLAFRFFTLGCGGVAGLWILKKCFSEMNITRIGFVTQIAGLMLLAFSDKTWMVFVVPAISILAGLMEPVFSSISSRLVSSEEQGVLFAIVGILSSIGQLVGSSLFNTIYPLSFRFNFPGFVFVFAAVISFCLLFMTWFVDVPPDVLNRKEDTSAEEKELNEKLNAKPSQENCTTVL